MNPDVDRIAAQALAEDGDTDITTAVTIPPGLAAEGSIEYRSDGVLAGAAFADAVARACDCRIEWRAPDGRTVRAGAVVGIVRGTLARILRAERPMLNLLQRASGIISRNPVKCYINFFYLRINSSFVKKAKNIIVGMIRQMKQQFIFCDRFKNRTMRCKTRMWHRWPWIIG